MPTLVLPPTFSEDTIRMAQAATRAGWRVERLSDWLIPDGTTYPDPVLYGEPPFTETIAPKLGVSVLTPPLDILYYLPRRFLKREVLPTTLGEARKMKGRYHIRPTRGKLFPMGVFHDGRGLPGSKNLGDPTPVLVCQVIDWEWQYRFFVADGKIATYSPVREGREPAMDSAGQWKFHPKRDREVKERVKALVQEAGPSLPAAFVVDFGLFDEKWAVTEIFSPCDCFLYGCSENEALCVLHRACQAP